MDLDMIVSSVMDDGENEPEQILLGAGRGSELEKRVPRLPHVAMLHRIDALEEATPGKRGRGRARLLKNRVSTDKEQQPGKRKVQAVAPQVQEPASFPQPNYREPERLYNGQWLENDFPNLAASGTGKDMSNISNNASSNTNSRVEKPAGQLTCKFIEESETELTSMLCNSAVDPLPLHQTDDGFCNNTLDTATDQQNHNMDSVQSFTEGCDVGLNEFNKPIHIVKPKKSVNKFNFAAANQSLLNDFRSIQDTSLLKPTKVGTLTMANLAKHSMETEKKFKRYSVHVTDNSLTENSDAPMYQQFAVTHEDIYKSKHSKVPTQVKQLMKAMDNYIASPSCDKLNGHKKENSSEMHTFSPTVSNNEEMINHDADKFHDVTTNENSGMKLVPKDDVDGECFNKKDDSGDAGSEISNVSCVSNMTDRSDVNNTDFSEDQNNSCYYDDINKDNVSMKNECDRIVNGSVEVNTLEADIPVDEIEIPEIEDSDEHSRKKDALIKESSEENIDLIVTKKVSNISLNDSVSKLDEFDFNSTSERQTVDSDQRKVSDVRRKNEDSIEDFTTVKCKKKRKKSNSPEINSVDCVTDNTVWRVYGKNVIQVDGLPTRCDVSDLHGMVCGFGTVLDYQVRQVDGGSTVRFKLCSEDACEFAVTCLHDTDCLFPDSNSVLVCYRLQV